MNEQSPLLQGRRDNMHKENWDDLRFMLAVAEQGSVSAAARALGVNHATVLRRIAAFEARHGGEIFDRTPQGYTVPQDRQNLVDAARSVEEAVFSLERLIESGQAPVSGVVRVTSTDTLCQGLLPPLLQGLQKDAADLRIELICSNDHLDLARLDADIAIKPAEQLQEGLVGTQAAQLGFGVFGDVALPWLGMSGAIARSRPAQWLAQVVDEKDVVAKADSFLTLREMAAAGIGKTILPNMLGTPDPRLQRIDVGMPGMAVGIWVTCHPDMAEVPRIRAVRTFLASALEQAGERFLAG